MKYAYRFFILFILCSGIAIAAYSQKQKVFNVDEDKILFNKNLEFYISRLNSAKFTILKSNKDIPRFIKDQLPFFNDRSIADTGGKYRLTDATIDSMLPDRKLVFLAKSKDVFIITYLKGGGEITNHIAFVRTKENLVTDIWSGNGCINCKSVKNILTYIQENKNRVWGLNNSTVDL